MKRVGRWGLLTAIGVIVVAGCTTKAASDVICTPSQLVRCNDCPLTTSGAVDRGWAQCSPDGTSLGECTDCEEGDAAPPEGGLYDAPAVETGPGPEADPPDADGDGDGGTNYGTCALDGGATGACIDTTACADEGGTSTPGYCPGPDNIQCCTGITIESGT